MEACNRGRVPTRSKTGAESSAWGWEGGVEYALKGKG